jgi:hypothetical protein
LQGVRKAVLPVLTKLLGDAEVREEVPHVLSQLLADNKDLQAAAADADAISKLASFLHHDGCSTRLKVMLCAMDTCSVFSSVLPVTLVI